MDYGADSNLALYSPGSLYFYFYRVPTDLEIVFFSISHSFRYHSEVSLLLRTIIHLHVFLMDLWERPSTETDVYGSDQSVHKGRKPSKLSKLSKSLPSCLGSSQWKESCFRLSKILTNQDLRWSLQSRRRCIPALGGTHTSAVLVVKEQKKKRVGRRVPPPPPSLPHWCCCYQSALKQNTEVGAPSNGPATLWG